jgi:hypothetical protein
LDDRGEYLNELQVNYGNLAKSLSISPPTAKSLVELLEKLYIIFLLPPYSNRLSHRVDFIDGAGQFDPISSIPSPASIALAYPKPARKIVDVIAHH